MCCYPEDQMLAKSHWSDVDLFIWLLRTYLCIQATSSVWVSYERIIKTFLNSSLHIFPMYPNLGQYLYDFNTGTHTYIWIYLMFLRKYTLYSNMLNLFCSMYNEELSIILGWCTMASLLKEGQTCWIWHFKFDTLKIMSNELFFCSVCWWFCLIFSDKMFSNRP